MGKSGDTRPSTGHTRNKRKNEKKKTPHILSAGCDAGLVFSELMMEKKKF